MQERTTRYSLMQRIAAIALTVALVFGIMPVMSFAADSTTSLKPGEIFTIADLETLTRPGDIYGENTLNAGKLTVGKSVNNAAVTLNHGSKNHTFTPAKNNFIVTISQAAQVMGLASQSQVPIDAVFVLDTSGSMGYNNQQSPTGRSEAMLEAANDAIASLLAANSANRVSVVAFSAQGTGGGTSSGAAANLLTPLDSYTGEAATNHLQWASSGGVAYSADSNNNNNNNRPGRPGDNDNTGFGIGSSYNYIMGRNNTGTAGRRHGGNGGTNIQAGIALGAQQLLNAASTQVTVNGKTVNRMPVIVVLSDGQPTYISSSNTWYNPSQTQQQGDGNDPYEGAGFMTMLTAAYYKSKVTEKYYGTTTGKDQCSFYTIGVELDELSGDDEALAQITMDPKTFTTGDYAASGADSYYNYGNSWNNNNQSTNHGIKTYWNNYLEGDAFTVRTTSGGTYTVTAQSITDTKAYVKSLAYNDDYFSADSVDELATAFSKLVSTIQLKAISSPTHVDVLTGADFSGYVTFTDPIGEYMEVKSMHGVLANGYLFQGAGFARRLKEGTDEEFNALLKEVLETRMLISDSNIDVDEFLAEALRSENQAYYESPSDYDNSIVWWGNGFTPAGEEDEKVQVLGNADDDSIEYIEKMRAEGKIPTDADYVCRSYFFYGTAGDTAETPEHEFLYFVVRVQRSLTAPYQQTVVISAPASLLSVETVLITEDTSTGTPTYTATVKKSEPARVIYEVGLRSDLNAYNLESVLSQDSKYLKETAGGALTNYDPVTGTYTFYTNDWDRAKAADSHERAMAKATFDAAADNSFYTYQEDTLILDEDGNPYTGSTAPTGLYYYSRTYYDWTDATLSEDGTYAATKETKLIEVRLPEDSSVVIQKDGKWYIAKGTYTASTLMVTGDDVEKGEGNRTETSEVVAHPVRTGEANNSHYTVYLGNNGKLQIRSVDTKTVDITPEGGTTIQKADGQIVTVGDTLTYKIQVINDDTVAVDATVTDKIPTGTAYVPGSASHSGSYNANTGVITWDLTDIQAGETVTVSFKVVVTEAALSGENDVASIENAGVVTLSNDVSYTTNKTSNPPVGKKVVDTEGAPIEDEVKAYDILVYRIRYYNDTANAAKITITDIIPTGTTYVADSASHGGKYDADENTLTWEIANVQPGASGVVSFRVVVNGDAGTTVNNHASIKIGSNNPKQTNTTEVTVDQGSLVVSKNVKVPDPADAYTQALAKEFTLHITEIGLDADGVYTLLKNGQKVDGGIRFTKGVATLTIKDDDVYEIQGLPAGAIFSVTEASMPGFTPSYKKTDGSTSAVEGRVTIPANNKAQVDVENTYAPASVNFQLKGSKVLDTTVVVPELRFGFTAIPCDSQGVASGNTSYLTGEVVVSSANKTAQIVFSPAAFYAPGTNHFLISEITGGVTGVTYAQNQYLLVVEVTDDGSGALKASASLKSRDGNSGSFADVGAYTDTGVVFTNKYEPDATQLVLAAKKVLTGRNLKDNEFSFEVRDLQGKLITSSTNAANGEISFRPITYTAADLGNQNEVTFTYEITELNNRLQGIAYDTTEYTITVTLKNEDGKLVATPSYPDGGVVFRNTYTPPAAFAVLEANKVLVNKSGSDRVLLPGEFNFIAQLPNTSPSATGTNDANGKIVFSAIPYTLADVQIQNGQYIPTEFTYTISEVVPVVNKDPYMTYDGNTFDVTVTLTYDPDKGELSTSVSYPDSGVTFTNTQHPNSIPVVPGGSKTTEGSNIPGDATFSFTAVNVDTGVEAAVGVGSANGEFKFSALSFSKAGTYRYWIKETLAGQTLHGITYDPTVYLLVVEVTLSNGELEETHAYYSLREGGNASKAEDYTVKLSGVPTFKNKYEAKGQLTIYAGKKLTGRNMAAGEFAFSLLDNQGREVATALSPAASAGESKLFAFSTLYFDAGDCPEGQQKTIKYQMHEVIPAASKLPGVTYDTKVYDVYVTIEHNNGVITAYLSDEYGNEAENATNTGIVFENKYAPVQGTSITIQASKELDGRDLEEGEFFFQMVDKATGNVVSTATNKADGSITFNYSYPAATTPGVYTYIIRERNDGMGGVTYTSVTYEVQVTVSDSGAGVLTAAVAYPNDRDDSIVFSNTYEPAPTTFTPAAKKVLLNRVMEDNEFVFQVSSNYMEEVISTGWSKADGTVEFSPIVFTQPGDFIYRVEETKGNLTNVEYADVVYYLCVHVEDNLDGTLTATGKYYTTYDSLNFSEPLSGEVEEPVFTNVYKPAGISVHLSASKVLTGRDMSNGEFSFVVLEGTTVKATGGNAAAKDGVVSSVLFSDIGYTIADAGNTYKYAIVELDTKQGGVGFDDTVFYVTVTIENDAQAGVLKPIVTYYEDDQLQHPIDASDVKFENTYSYTPISIPVHADKILVNKKLEDKEFTFYLKDEDGRVLQTVQNDEDGHIYFADIPITAPGTYFYTVEEKNDGVSNYTYDDSKYILKVVVTGADGVLTPVVTCYKNNENTVVDNGIEFVNAYKPSSIIKDLSTKIDAEKVVNTPAGITYSPAGFKFKVVDVAGATVQGKDKNGETVDMIGVSNADGEINFPSFVFDKAGEYHYWVSELPSSKPGVEDDLTVWEIHILVRYDEENGTLYIGENDVKTYKVSRASGEASKVQFVNTYAPNSVTVTLLAKKKLEGRPLQNNEFVFHLMEGDIIRAEARNDEKGNIVFEMNYTEIGVHTYKIREHNNGLGGVDYDDVTYDSVTIEITDNGSGQLIAKVGNENVGGEQVDTNVTFTNVYATTAATAVVKAGKYLTGGKALKEGMFTFELRDENDELVANAVNDAEGNVVFHVNNLTQIGTFQYTMKETRDQNSDSHIEYDESEHTVYIKVTDNLKGALVAEVEYDNDENTPPIFINSYTPDEYQLKITATKRLVGRRLRNNEFVFEVRNSLGEVVETAKNAANGSITFPTIKLDSEGEHVFTIHEVTGSLNDVTYDTTVYTVKVTVTNDDGVLNGEVEYPAGGVIFVNEYESTVPKTGDNGMFLLYLSMLCVSCGAVISLSMLRKKDEKAC